MDLVISTLAGELVDGCSVLGVVREYKSGHYEHFLVLEARDNITRVIPVGQGLTVHSYEGTNKYRGAFL